MKTKFSPLPWLLAAALIGWAWFVAGCANHRPGPFRLVTVQQHAIPYQTAQEIAASNAEGQAAAARIVWSPTPK